MDLRQKNTNKWAHGGAIKGALRGSGKEGREKTPSSGREGISRDGTIGMTFDNNRRKGFNQVKPGAGALDPLKKKTKFPVADGRLIRKKGGETSLLHSSRGPTLAQAGTADQ